MTSELDELQRGGEGKTGRQGMHETDASKQQRNVEAEEREAKKRDKCGLKHVKEREVGKQDIYLTFLHSDIT